MTKEMMREEINRVYMNMIEVKELLLKDTCDSWECKKLFIDIDTMVDSIEKVAIKRSVYRSMKKAELEMVYNVAMKLQELLNQIIAIKTEDKQLPELEERHVDSVVEEMKEYRIFNLRIKDVAVYADVENRKGFKSEKCLFMGSIKETELAQDMFEKLVKLLNIESVQGLKQPKKQVEICKEVLDDTYKNNDRKIEKRINGELDRFKMAYKIKDREGNIFIYGGIENGTPWYRTRGGSKHIFDLIGFEIIEQYCSL